MTRVSRVAVVLLVAACSSGGGEPGLPVWEAVPDLTIGGAEEGPLSFSDIRSLAVDGAGRIYVLEAKEQQVRVFAPDGSYLRQVGQRGEGPGEFQRANGVATTPDGGVWVYSPPERRMVEFDSAGAFITSHMVVANSYGWMWQGGVDSSAHLIDLQFLRIDTASVRRVVRTDLRRDLVDTLPLPDCPATNSGYYSFPRGSMVVPFGSGQLLALDARGVVWCGDTRTLELHQYRIGEVEPTHTLVADLAPAPVSPAERDSAIASVEKFKEQAGDANLDYSLIGQTKPIVEGVAMDERGRVWVRARTDAGFRMVVFGADGTPIAQVPLPESPGAYSPLVVHGDRIYFTVRDADDVPSVVRYVVRGAGGR